MRWQAVISGFLTPDSSSSSMRASTLRARGSSRSPCMRTSTLWGSPRSAGWSYAKITMQRTTPPPYRDEQRAWYDTLRDLVPSIKGLQPTVRLYARDWAWCSLNPDSREDRERFSGLIHKERSPSSRTTVEIHSPTVRPESILRVAMVFPQVKHRSSDGVPPAGAGAQQPDVPVAASFATPLPGAQLRYFAQQPDVPVAASFAGVGRGEQFCSFAGAQGIDVFGFKTSCCPARP